MSVSDVTVIKKSLYLGPLEELGLCEGHILGLAAPRAQHGGLQGASVAEGQCPRLAANVLVDGVQIDGGILLRLASRQEGDT